MRTNPDFQPISNPASLSDVNYILDNFALPQLSPAAFDALKKSQPRATLISALRNLQFKGDKGAYTFLFKQIQHVQELVQGEPRGNTPASRAGGQGMRADERDRAQPKADQPRPAPSASRPGEDQADEQERAKSVHVYGGKGALCFEEDETKNGFHTISLDAAPSTGPKQYDWAQKIRLQLTREELPVLLAVMLGVLPQCEYKNHGPQNNKGFSVQDQGNQYFVRVYSPDGVRAVPMTPEDAFRVTAMLIKQMRKNYEGLEAGDILTLVRVVIGKKGMGKKGMDRK